MSKRPSLSLTLVMTLLGGVAVAALGCGGDGAKEFGGGDSGGSVGTGGGAASTGGAPAGSGGQVGSGGAPGTGTGGTDATGGASATGGAGMNSGGNMAIGGRTASGGGTGTGGTPATGGRPGTGGAPGTGGNSGSGGVTGTGGRPGTGGNSGSGGATATCDGIAADYQAALPAARACNTITGLTVPQCQLMAPSSLGCGSNCIIYVQDNEKLTELQKRWNNAGCPSMIRACPAVACIDAKPGNCYATTTGGAALCQNGPKI